MALFFDVSSINCFFYYQINELYKCNQRYTFATSIKIQDFPPLPENLISPSEKTILSQTGSSGAH